MSHDQKTETYPSLDIGDPVATVSELPEDATEGTAHYVTDEAAIYVCRDGEWKKEISRR